MKNKGRKHIAGIDSGCPANGKGMLTSLTKPINKMGRNSLSKWSKRKWQKRMRGYLKTKRGIELFMT